MVQYVGKYLLGGVLVLVLVMVMLGPALRFLYPIDYQAEITNYAGENRLDPFLVAAVIQVESNFRPGVVSQKGARGLMQLMPETACWIGAQMGDGPVEPDKLFVPEVNIRLGTWYLANLYKEFGDRGPAVLAAYNAGRGNVRQWLETGQWSGELDDWHQIPFAETRDFVRRVTIARDFYRWIHRGRWPFPSDERRGFGVGTDQAFASD